jgi:hypothetical protein
VTLLAIRVRNQAAQTQSSKAVSQATGEARRAKTLVAPGVIEGTMSFV